MSPRLAAKEIVKAILPKRLTQFIQCCRYRGFLAHIRYSFNFRRYRERFARANAAAPESTLVLPDVCNIRVPPGSSEIRDSIEFFGWRDPDAVEESIGFMKAATGKKVLWDIGALHGFFSLAFTLVDEGRRALAFEPNPDSRARLKDLLLCNPRAKVDIFDFAIGLPAEVVTFQKGFHFIAAAGLEAQPAGELIQLETESIDHLIERNFDPPDIIKIDVEGHELEVLQGASTLLRLNKPLLSLEVHPGQLLHRGVSPIVIAKYLEDAGYVFRNMQHKPVSSEYFKRTDTFRVLAM